MLHNTILQPFATYEVNQEGRYIKVMSCESEFRLVAWRGAEKLLDSDVVAGAEIALSGDFKRLSIVSETEQKVRLWVSEHKLNYDALSTKPNRANSFVVEHYGESQKVTVFDPAQSGIKLLCAHNWWVGGEGVNSKNGIPVLANEIYKHDSAAPIYAYIDEPIARNLLLSDGTNIATTCETQPSVISQLTEDLLFVYGPDSGFIRISTGQFNSLENSNHSHQLLGEPVSFDDKIYSLTDRKVGEISLVQINDFGDYAGQPTRYVVDPLFWPTDMCATDDAIYVTGAYDSSRGRAKVYRIKSGEPVLSYEPNINTGAAALVINKIMHLSGSFYLNVDNKLYRCSNGFNDCEAIFSESNIKTFRANHVQKFGEYRIFKKVVSSQYGILALDNENTPVSFPTTPKCAFFDSRLIYYADTTGIHASSDGGASFQLKIEFANADIGDSAGTAFIQSGQFIYFVGYANGALTLKRFGSEVDRTTPKATFRVLKESY
ncbi:hypothetical protein [Pseudoalteromonas maricaloris]|uniref:Uncharacterized protein n=1 Tax=Pseudoalteromonas maricaloris TaxID=184924 RepID=A0A8I2KP11_9GAMM|nr:hypothetical protein [Pseudoalteromonas maricaloris]NLR24379.1 hypothetical protein [Pseudoalteromonas maricaloris]WOX26911.1 hypothetical protein R5H13_09530 [Pseudoalteromonas maricaloris]WOX31387.1 hypothetical protein R5H13_20830 [Pseudoalteromonas maricaloris]